MPTSVTEAGPRVAQETATPFGAFFAKAAFQGMVKEIDQRTRTFTAQLWPMRGYIPADSDIEVDEADGSFPFDCVDEDDTPLVAVGSVFTWMTGYREGDGIPRKWESNLRFRRLPPRSREELEKLAQGADAYVDLFKDK